MEKGVVYLERLYCCCDVIVADLVAYKLNLSKRRVGTQTAEEPHASWAPNHTIRKIKVHQCIVFF